MSRITTAVIAAFCVINRVHAKLLEKFPDDFIFGVSTAAYQIEGAWNEDGKGESIWDRLTHTKPHLIEDGSNGDVACDSYHLYKRDIEMVADLEVDFYRFSISWPRVLPTGTTDLINAKGVQYYNDLIDGLLARNVTPLVTIYHWDLPQKLQDLGGWPNPIMVEYYEAYADFLFRNFGDRVKNWVTINEPWHVCFGYSTEDNAPAMNYSGIGDYLCTHSILKAHARAYRLYENVYRSLQGGVLGIILDIGWHEPETNSKEDLESAERARQFLIGWYAHPIFSKFGDYPPIMRKIVDKKSNEQGFYHSRLPRFSKEEIEMIKGSADFFGLNHYTSWISYEPRTTLKHPIPSHEDDFRKTYYQDSKWPVGSLPWLKITPWGFRKILNWIKNEYGNPPLLVTENGFASDEGLEDDNRISYFKGYLQSLLQAIHVDKCNVIGYGAWSLMDNFEWEHGYRGRFGLYEVDFNSTNRTRTMRKSGRFLRNVIRTRSIENIDGSELKNFS